MRKRKESRCGRRRVGLALPRQLLVQPVEGLQRDGGLDMAD
jgi:hypothetical protein